jgi:AhpD family alkylhydroperoxidase
MSAVSLVTAEQAPLLARRFYASGDPGPVVSALAQVPELLEVAAPFLGTVLGPTALPARLKEVVVLRTSVVAGCRFCIDSHTVVAWDSGLDADEVAWLRDEGPVPSSLSPLERAAAGFSERMWSRPEGAVELLRPHLEDHGIVEMTLLCATTMLLNRLCTALALPVSPEVSRRLAAGR